MRSTGLCLFSIFLFVNCSSSTKRSEAFPNGSVYGHPDSAYWRAVPPLDTLTLLRTIEISGHKEMEPSLDTTSNIQWQPTEDTIIVSYAAYACTCPDHEVLDTSQTGGIKSFYVLPSEPSLSIPWRTQVSGNRYELIGTVSVAPSKPEETMGPSEPGYFFRYRSYRIMNPYKVWGPHLPTLDRQEDELEWGAAAKLIVE